jgi:hypothetical protein
MGTQDSLKRAKALGGQPLGKILPAGGSAGQGGAELLR